MISDNITKQDFIIQVLERDIRNIYKAQLVIAQQNIYISGKELKETKRRGAKIRVRSGALLKSLENPDFMIQAQGEKFIVSAGIVKHMRFLDMKRISSKGKEYDNWKIYNRQVWGILYNNALKDIKYNYGKEIADRVSEALHEAFPGEHSSSGKSSGKSFGEQYSDAKKR